jgi:valyl-tRNA synthetase
VPERFEKVYLHWLENIRDWCISRQLWWGHRIPAYYCDACGEIIVARERPESCPSCGAPGASDTIRQDEDVLDTWFSSALWPFSTLGWPEKTPDLDYFYPTNVLVTGYDIIFFWIVRMVFSGCDAMGEVPFGHVFVHGLVRAGDGAKMSKSLGNGVDPIEVIDEYGADALRFMLIDGSAAGNDMRFTMDKIESARNFANKLWNASRFIIMNLGEGGAEAVQSLEIMDPGRLRDEDRWILEKVSRAATDITRNIESFDLSVATQKIYELARNEYCDWYIEFVKPRLAGDDEGDKETVRAVLISALSDLLRLLHPFMPFITEEIWSFLGKGGKLIVDRWPEFPEEGTSSSLSYEKIEVVKEIVRAVRGMRKDAGAAPSRALPIVIKPDRNADGGAGRNADGGAGCNADGGAGRNAENERHDDVEVSRGSLVAKMFPESVGGAGSGTEVKTLIGKLANVSKVTIAADDGAVPDDSVSAILTGLTVFIDADDLFDYEAERERLGKEKDRLENNIARLRGKLSNEGFTSKAPESVVRTEQGKLTAEEDAYDKVLARLASIAEK